MDLISTLLLATARIAAIGLGCQYWDRRIADFTTVLVLLYATSFVRVRQDNQLQVVITPALSCNVTGITQELHHRKKAWLQLLLTCHCLCRSSGLLVLQFPTERHFGDFVKYIPMVAGVFFWKE